MKHETVAATNLNKTTISENISNEGEVTVKDSDFCSYIFKKLFDTLKHAFATFCFKSERYVNLTVDVKSNYNVPRCADKLGSFLYL